MIKADKTILKYMFATIVQGICLILILITDSRDSELFRKEIEEFHDATKKTATKIEEWVNDN